MVTTVGEFLPQSSEFELKVDDLSLSMVQVALHCGQAGIAGVGNSFKMSEALIEISNSILQLLNIRPHTLLALRKEICR